MWAGATSSAGAGWACRSGERTRTSTYFSNMSFCKMQGNESWLHQQNILFWSCMLKLNEFSPVGCRRWRAGLWPAISPAALWTHIWLSGAGSPESKKVLPGRRVHQSILFKGSYKTFTRGKNCPHGFDLSHSFKNYAAHATACSVSALWEQGSLLNVLQQGDSIEKLAMPFTSACANSPLFLSGAPGVLKSAKFGIVRKLCQAGVWESVCEQ